MVERRRPDVVVITGASAGVGRATAWAFARRGAWLGLIARDRERLELTQVEVMAVGGKAVIYQVDAADAEGMEKAAEEVEEQFGPIDIWVNNVMTTVFAPTMQIGPEEFRRVTEVTYLGYVYGTQAALRRMVPRDRGVIVQVGSALSIRSIPLQSPYCGAKHAVRGFTDSVRSELLHDKSKVHLTMVQLPGLNTPQFVWGRSRMPNKAQPVPPIYQPEVAADAIVWAAYHRRREWYVGWPVVGMIVGDKFFAGLLDRYLARTSYLGQQTDEPRDPNSPDNLFAPLEGDFGAHGPFDKRARRWSLQFALSKHRAWAMVLLILAAAALLLW